MVTTGYIIVALIVGLLTMIVVTYAWYANHIDRRSQYGNTYEKQVRHVRFESGLIGAVSGVFCGFLWPVTVSFAVLMLVVVLLASIASVVMAIPSLIRKHIINPSPNKGS